MKVVETTNGSIISQSITYNQSGLTYNTGTVQYGGFNNIDGPAPRMSNVRL